MEKTDQRIDAYISKAADFAQPILHHFRALVHKASPKIIETIKWGAPFFEYKGTVCGMAAFKQHCAIVIHKAKLLQDPQKALSLDKRQAMGQLNRITTLQDLPKDAVLIDLLREVVALNEKGIKAPAKPKAKKPLPDVPEALAKALKKNKKAAAYFDKLSDSHKREYIEWIAEAKQLQTIEKRVATTIEWLLEGKSRNWKYKS